MKNTNSKFSIVGYFLFLIPLTLTISFGIVIFNLLETKINNLAVTATFLLIYILITTLIFCILDIFRRRQMIDKPVEQILKATEKIASGDFSVKLFPIHSLNRFDHYDQIMANINRMANELSKSEILKKDFISNVSHELKTPLALIKSYAQLLLNPNLDTESKKNYLSCLVSTTSKLSNLVTNILKLNKLENQIIIEKHETINIGEVVRNSALQILDLIEAKQIEFNCDIDDITISTDSSFVEIIVNNLLSNAIKFTDNGGKISLSLKDGLNHIVLKVADTGIGISPDSGKRIFEKFYQADPSHSSEGNGLGLALVKRIIDILGGEISVESEPQKGSTFTVKLKKERV